MTEPTRRGHLSVVGQRSRPAWRIRALRIIAITAALTGAAYWYSHNQAFLHDSFNKVSNLMPPIIAYGLECELNEQNCVHKLFAAERAGRNVDPATETLALQKFLATAESPKHPYVMPTFVCVQFAQSLILEGRRKSVPVLYVRINFEDNPVGHALNALPHPGSENGYFFFDSTSNAREIVKYAIGERPIYVPQINPQSLAMSYAEAKKLAHQSALGRQKRQEIEAKLQSYQDDRYPPDLVKEYNRLTRQIRSLPYTAFEQGVVKEVWISSYPESHIDKVVTDWVNQHTQKL